MQLLSLCFYTSALACFIYVANAILHILRFRWRVLRLGLPTFQGPPLVGNSLQLMKIFGAAPGIPFSVYTLEVINGFRKALQEQELFLISIGPFCYIALTSPDTVEALLSDNQQVNKSDDYDFLHPWLGTGLITSSYKKWRKHRKLLTPAFHFKILDEFQPTIYDYSDTLICRLKSQVDEKWTDLEPYLTTCALDIIGGTALGIEIGAQKTTSSPYVKALHHVAQSIFTRMLSPWLWYEPIFWITPTGRKTSQNLNVISNFIKKAIKDKKAMLSERRDEVLRSQSEEGTKVRRAFLEMMLIHNMVNQDNQFSDQDIEDEVNTFTFAGHDTTTTGMIWTLYLLGVYPEVQAKVQEELDDILGRDLNRPITLDDVKKMQYMDLVIKESQRLYPSIPYISRKLDKDFQIKDTVLPAGVVAVVVPPVLHRDPVSFPNPEVFDPDRFLNRNKHPFSYVPFSAGPRNCIGQRFAMIEMKTVLGNMLRNFTVTSLDPRDKVLVCSEIVTRPHKPIRTKLQIRT